jgi:transcriptional regulator with XRE-family HTH domain
MGLASRRRPQKLAAKLKQVRISLNLSQTEMVKKLGLEDEMERERISKYERGILEPPLHVLYEYSKISNCYLEIFVNDEIDLPPTIPSFVKYEGSEKISE